MKLRNIMFTLLFLALNNPFNLTASDGTLEPTHRSQRCRRVALFCCRACRCIGNKTEIESDSESDESDARPYPIDAFDLTVEENLEGVTEPDAREVEAHNPTASEREESEPLEVIEYWSRADFEEALAAGMPDEESRGNHIICLNGLDLEGIQIIGKEESPVIIRNYSFEEVKLPKAVLKNIQFINCTFYNVRFEETAKLNNVVFEGCPMNGANFSGMDLFDIELKNCDLRSTDFSFSRITKVLFESCKFNRGTNFFDTWLRDVHFGETNPQGPSPGFQSLLTAKYGPYKANFTGARFFGVQLVNIGGLEGSFETALADQGEMETEDGIPNTLPLKPEELTYFRPGELTNPDPGKSRP